MMTTWEILTGIRDACSGIADLATCQIGIETPIVPTAYPMLRVVPSVLRPREKTPPWRPDMEIIVYYGEYVRPLDEMSLEAQYEWLLGIEDRIKRAIVPGAGWRAAWEDTVWDEDRIPGLKLFASRFIVSP